MPLLGNISLRVLSGFIAGVVLSVTGFAQGTLPPATVGSAYSYQVSTIPPAPVGTIYTATGLPAGLSIHASSGLITGVPASAGIATGSLALTAGGVTNRFPYSLAVTSGSVPQVVITWPVAGATLTIGTTPAPSVSLAAAAYDSDGTITQVQFLVDGVALGADTAFPYQFDFTPTAPGVYALTAAATDNVGNVTHSSPVQLTVEVAFAPTVSITSPAAGEMLPSNVTRSLAAAVMPSAGRAVLSVTFYANGILVGTDTSFPFAVDWTPTTPGPYSLTAVAMDNLAVPGTSTSVAVTVGAGSLPTVAITSPPPGATLPANVPHLLTATASAFLPASVVAVRFRADDVLIGTDTVAPYGVLWTPTSGGMRQLTVEVIDSFGWTSISSPIVVNVVLPPAVVTSSGRREVVGFQQNLTLSSTVTGFPAPTLQWKRNGLPLAGATNAHHTISAADPVAHAGWYELVASNDSGVATSTVIFVNVAVPADPLVGWGNPASSLNSIPAGLTEVAGLATGGFLSIAVKRDGTVATWGTLAPEATTIPAGLTGVVAVAAGESHGLALRSDGTVVAWGLDNQGQLAVPAGLDDVVAIAAGGFHNLALKRDGTVIGWGLNDEGQTAVPAGLNQVGAIAAGYQHSLALKMNGTVVAWGSDRAGETAFAHGRTGVAAVAGGFYDSLILETGGTVVAGGDNSYGQSTVPAGLGGVVAIAAGYFHHLARKQDGTLVTWGRNTAGETSLPAGVTRAAAIAAGLHHSLVLRLPAVPTVFTPPRDLAVTSGQLATFSVAAAGGATALTYQWHRDGVPVPGATGASLTIPSARLADAGAYGVTVSSGPVQAVSPLARLSVAPTTYPAAMGLDPAFAPVIEIAGGIVNSVVVQSDGKIVVGGSFTGINGRARRNLARLHPDGTVDALFDPGTGPNEPVNVVALQADGRILIGGEFTQYNRTPRGRLARVHGDGSLDVSFDSGTGADYACDRLALQSDGKIVVVGSFSTYNGIPRHYVARVNSDGSLDETFNPGSGPSATVRAVLVLPDGRILLGGWIWNYDGVARDRLVRLHSNGTLDTTFFASGAAHNVYAMLALPDGKLLTGGESHLATRVLTRLNADGSTDASFTPGIGPNDDVKVLLRQSDGKVLVGGLFTSYNGAARSGIARLNADGTLDTDFVPPFMPNVELRTLALQSDGNVVAAGRDSPTATPPRAVFVRHLPNGAHNALPAEFRSGGTVYALEPQRDGKFVIGGRFNLVNGVSRNGIARLLADGALDPTFDPGVGAGAEGSVRALALQPDGKVLAGGYFTAMGGLPRNNLARLRSDGALDAAFNPGGGPDGEVLALALLPNGKAIVGGNFNHFAGVSRDYLARIHSDGSLDGSFTSGGGPDHMVTSLVRQPDDFLVVGGAFTFYNGVRRGGVVRLRETGSEDATFSRGTGSDGAWGTNAMAVEPSGRIIVGGYFSSFSGAPRDAFARVNADASVDPTYATAAVPEINVAGAMLLQADGKVIAGEGFNANDTIGLVRLGLAGASDPSFSVAGLRRVQLGRIMMLDDGSLVVAGRRFHDGVTDQAGVARLARVAAPVISTPPGNRTLAAGGDVRFSVTVTGVPAPAYQWLKDGVVLPGACQPTLALPAVHPGASGLYSVVITNAAGSVTSPAARLAVIPTGVAATHAAASPDFLPGGTVTVTNAFSHTGGTPGLSWQVLLPPGWSLASSTGDAGSTKPASGSTSLLTWNWPAVSPAPLSFSYTLNVPAGERARRELAALVTLRAGGAPMEFLALSDPLVLRPPGHSADTDRDFAFSLFELTRVIELYNTRAGTQRTGAYRPEAANREDGFAGEPARAPGAAVALERYHSADTRGAAAGSAPDGAIDLFELTRVIELYNTRAGTVRTGRYRVQSGTEDGFAGGP